MYDNYKNQKLPIAVIFVQNFHRLKQKEFNK